MTRSEEPAGSGGGRPAFLVAARPDCANLATVRWTDQPVFFIDFEGSRTSGILEYGVATLLRGRIVDTRTRLCRATGTVRAEDAAVHGLHAGDVAAQEPIAADWEYFAGLRERGPLAAHFAHVENSLLKSVWSYPRSSPDFARPGERMAEWGPWIDTGRIYTQMFPRLPSARLEDLVAAGGLQAQLDATARTCCPAGRRRYHAALYDAVAGALLLGRLAEEPALANRTVAWLLTLSTANPKKRDELSQGRLF